MIDLQTAEKALKTVYLGVVSQQLNTNVHPFLTKIQQTSSDVWGKDVVKAVTYGLNGGIGAGTETGVLPRATGNNYAQFKIELKNLYGQIEISDKAIRASQSNSGAFVNLLNAEMEGLLNASKHNLSRMLVGDGTGKLAVFVTIANNPDKCVMGSKNIQKLAEGMVVDFYKGATNAPIETLQGRKIIAVDRIKKSIRIEGANTVDIVVGDYCVLQGSKDKEISGIDTLFNGTENLYGVPIAQNPWLKPYVKKEIGAMNIAHIQDALDSIEKFSGNPVDIIMCAYNVKKTYIELLSTNRTNLDYMTLDGGFKCLSFGGIPFVADRFMNDGDMFLLNSNDFKLHQLCDWRWLEGESGNVLKQNHNHATYTATLVKYAELLCERPMGQAKLQDIA